MEAVADVLRRVLLALNDVVVAAAVPRRRLARRHLRLSRSSSNNKLLLRAVDWVVVAWDRPLRLAPRWVLDLAWPTLLLAACSATEVAKKASMWTR